MTEKTLYDVHVRVDMQVWRSLGSPLFGRLRKVTSERVRDTVAHNVSEQVSRRSDLSVRNIIQDEINN